MFATRRLADIERSSIAAAIIDSCPSRLFLPNDRTIAPQIKVLTERFGRNDRQIEISAQAQPNRSVSVQGRQRNRQFEPGLEPSNLAFVSASSKPDLARIAGLLGEVGADRFA